MIICVFKKTPEKNAKLEENYSGLPTHPLKFKVGVET